MQGNKIARTTQIQYQSNFLILKDFLCEKENIPKLFNTKETPQKYVMDPKIIPLIRIAPNFLLCHMCICVCM